MKMQGKILQYEKNKDAIRERLTESTQKAFAMLPRMDKPHILDIGCGSGTCAIKLAGLSNGEITALDIDQYQLDRLGTKLKDHNLQNRVKIVKCSMLEMDFPPSSFDIIWAEGSIYAIGFERGLKEWRHLLKSKGFLAVHDDRGDVESKLDLVKKCGYYLMGYFVLTNDVWWNKYYAPLEKEIQNFMKKLPDDTAMPDELKNDQKEIDMYHKIPQRFESVFIVMQKSE
jgi:ubiquinone/menaquinone biosynthesis C-methylase UbiE